MTIKPIRNDDDLRRAFRRLEKIFQAAEGTPQADERNVLVTLIEAYENKHHDFGREDPVEAIKFRMEQEGLTPGDLEPYIGQSGRVYSVLNRRRPLSLRMVRRLHDGLKIPYESLMTGVQSSVDSSRESSRGRRESSPAPMRALSTLTATMTARVCRTGASTQLRTLVDDRVGVVFEIGAGLSISMDSGIPPPNG